LALSAAIPATTRRWLLRWRELAAVPMCKSSPQTGRGRIQVRLRTDLCGFCLWEVVVVVARDTEVEASPIVLAAAAEQGVVYLKRCYQVQTSEKQKPLLLDSAVLVEPPKLQMTQAVTMD
jgi:hypothetical protein